MVVRGVSAQGLAQGGSGIRRAYAMARESWMEGGNDRLIKTIGDFNVEVSSEGELIDLIEREP